MILVAGSLLVGPLLAGSAFAGRTAALLPTLRPAGSPELRDRFQEAVTRGLKAAGLDAIPAAEVRMRLSGSEEQLTCGAAGPCAARVASSLRADTTLASEVVIAGKDYTIRLKLLDASGHELAHAEETCDICTVKEADEAVTRATTKIAAARAATGAAVVPPPPVETPPGKPVEPPPPPPPAPRVEPTPAPPPAPIAQPEPQKPLAATSTERAGRKPFPWRPVAITSAVVGAVGVIVGATLVGIDGKPTCTAPAGQDPNKFCKEVYNTGGGGGALLGLGLAGLAASAALFYFDYRARHRPPAAVSVVPLFEGGVLATVGGRF